MKELESLGEWNGWQVYKNSEGFLEGYMSTGRKYNLYKDANGNQVKASSDSKRIVTNATDMAGFISFVNGQKKKEPKIKIVPLPKLFEDETDLPPL